MNYYTVLKQELKDDLFREKLEDVTDLIEIQIVLMSWYRHAYCCLKNNSITNDETITLGCTIKNVVRSISYSLYYNQMMSIDDIIKLFDENIEKYEKNPID